MIQVQVVIELDATRSAVAVNVLARADATPEERRMAAAMEELCLIAKEHLLMPEALEIAAEKVKKAHEEKV